MNIVKFWAWFERRQVTDWYSTQELVRVYSSQKAMREDKKNLQGCLFEREVYGFRLSEKEIVLLGDAVKLVS